MSENDNSARLEEILGFDAGKAPSVTRDVLTEALEKVQEKRKEEALVIATELLEKAMALQIQHAKRVREFDGASKKFQKELGKLVSKLNGFTGGAPVNESEDSDESNEENDVA